MSFNIVHVYYLLKTGKQLKKIKKEQMKDIFIKTNQLKLAFCMN